MTTNSQKPKLGGHLPKEEQIAKRYRHTGNAEKQHYLPPQLEATRHYAGHNAGLPNDTPYMTGEMQDSIVSADEEELEENDAYYQTRLPTSVRRYQSLPEVLNKQGRINIVEHYHDQPLRAHRHQLPPPPQHEQYVEEVEPIPGKAQRRRHPLLWFGLFCILLTVGWIGLNFVTTWYQNVQNDLTYGTKRHFEIDAVVGHSDSPTNPTHFTAENDNGQIIVIELPGGNVSKAKIYQIEIVPGNAGNPPVKLSFQDLNGDGKPDMLVQIGEGAAIFNVTLFNNSSQFVSKL